MNTGIPGTGLATIFYIFSVLAMPLVEVYRGSRGAGFSGRRWLLIARHTAVAAVMAVILYGTVSWLLPDVRLPHSPFGQATSIALTLGLLLLLVATTVVPSRNRAIALRPTGRPEAGPEEHRRVQVIDLDASSRGVLLSQPSPVLSQPTRGARGDARHARRGGRVLPSWGPAAFVAVASLNEEPGRPPTDGIGRHDRGRTRRGRAHG